MQIKIHKRKRRSTCESSRPFDDLTRSCDVVLPSDVDDDARMAIGVESRLASDVMASRLINIVISLWLMQIPKHFNNMFLQLVFVLTSLFNFGVILEHFRAVCT